MVVFCTTYALILPAVTMEADCQIPEHTHSDDCYTQVVAAAKEPICTPETLEIHKHTADCKDAEGALTCGYADFVVHVHDAACYDEEGRLWCPLPEIREHRHTAACYAPVSAHVHSEECYAHERGALICPLHEHTEACWAETEVLVCGQAETPGHRHTEACRDEGGSLICGLEESESHQHSADCFTQHTEITCGLEESEGHQHSAACYQLSKELICGIDSDHQHTDECYDMVDALICGEEEAPDTAAEPICSKKEAILHTHTAGCFDKYGALICGQIEVRAHQHDDACFAEEEGAGDETILTCTNTDENHVHTPRCYGTWGLTCGMEERTHTDACYTSAAPETTPEDTSEDTPDDTADTQAAAAGTLDISLLYGDEKTQAEHPDGMSYYTHTNMSGYLKLEPDGLENDLTDVTVTITIPKQYVEKDSVKIPVFNTNSSATQYEILPVEEDGENYCTRIHFTAYDKTQTLELPFLLSFMDDVVPDNYVLPVTASVSGGSTTEPLLYKPQYKDWGIEKFVNSNRYKEFKEDGAEVVVTPQEEGGNPYLDDLTYVDFAFTVNGCTYEGADLRDWRDVCEVTLTDTLPKYTDRNGLRRSTQTKTPAGRSARMEPRSPRPTPAQTPAMC